MVKTAISSAMGVGKSRKASELRRTLLGGAVGLLVDPLGFDAGDSNLYRYVNNIPTGGTDSSGLQEGLQLPPIDATRNRRVTLFVPSMAFSKEIFIGKGQNATDIINLNIQAYAKGKAFKIFYSDQEITKFYNQAISDKNLRPFTEWNDEGIRIPRYRGNKQAFVEAAKRNKVPESFVVKFLDAVDRTDRQWTNSERVAAWTAAGILVGGGVGWAFGAIKTGVEVGILGGATGIYAGGWKEWHKICSDWVVDFSKNLETEVGGTNQLYKAANGGIKLMGMRWWDVDPTIEEGHTAFRVVFRNGDEFYIDVGILDGGAGATLRKLGQRFATKDQVAKDWKVHADSNLFSK